MKNILFAAAGSGGHLFPAIAIAKEMEKNCEIHFLSTGRNLEEMIPKNYQIHSIQKLALRGTGIKGLIKFFINFPSLFLTIRSILKTHKINYVLGMGGYTSGPAIVTAFFMGIRTGMIEPNSSTGISNKLSIPFVKDIFVSFLSLKNFENLKKKVKNFGLPQIEQSNSDVEYQDWDIVVMGGSQGAFGINKKIRQLIEEDFFKQKKILWQTGKLWEKENQNLSNDLIIQKAFIKNIKNHLKTTKMAISRTGAGACHDLVDTLTPSILIPLPNKKDPHYLKNAIAIVSKNGGLLYHEHQDLEILKKEINHILGNEKNRLKMKQNLEPMKYSELPSKAVAKFIMETINV